MTNKRNRRTREEMLAHYQAQIARLEAAMTGAPDTSSEAGVLKSLRARLRKTETALRAAQITLNGVRAEDGKGYVRSPIADKIEQTKLRLAAQERTKAEAEEQTAALPFDIERLSALVAAGEQGEEVEFPEDLTPLPGEENRTDEQHEASFIANGEAEERDAKNAKR